MSSGFAVINKSVCIREVFEAAVATANVAAFQKGVTLVNDDELDGEQVMGDEQRLRIALVNVLSNAVKFTPPGGSVKAKAYSADGCVKCVISDDGPGIPRNSCHTFLNSISNLNTHRPVAMVGSVLVLLSPTTS